jgi:N-acetylmuramic acid 6-phosphate etherase
VNDKKQSPPLASDTERASPRYAGIDQWDAADALDAMIEGQFAAVGAVRSARADIERAAAAMEARLKDGGRIIYAGAGTSGRLAVQDGAELMPTFSWPKDRVLLLIAGGHEALLHAVEGAEDASDHAANLILEHLVGPDDVIMAVAASGTTPFTLACQRAAKQCGALTIGIANNRDTPLLDEADCPIFLDTGPEPIAGSTRMKAGTAQRITLSLLSSLVMIRMGRVYQGLMVDVQTSNKKLAQRAEKMLQHLTGRAPDEVKKALANAGGSVKLAVLILEGCSAGDAKKILEGTAGHLRGALSQLGKGV